MNGRKAKTLRRAATARATHDGKLGYIERKIPYQSKDRHGKTVMKKRRTIQLRYHPMSWRPLYRRMKKAYSQNPAVRAALAGS